MKLYKVIKEDSNIKGYWLDKGKLYKDNIKIIPCKDNHSLYKGIRELLDKGELAVFYSIGDKGYCVDNKNRETCYNYRIRLHRKKLSCKEFKKLVKTFGGVTVYKLYDRYIIEVYHN